MRIVLLMIALAGLTLLARGVGQVAGQRDAAARPAVSTDTAAGETRLVAAGRAVITPANIDRLEPLLTFATETATLPSSLRFSADGARLLVTQSQDPQRRVAYIYDLATGSRLNRIEHASTFALRGATLSQDGRALITPYQPEGGVYGSFDAILMWDVLTGRAFRFALRPPAVVASHCYGTSASYLPSGFTYDAGGRLLAYTPCSGGYLLWAVRTGEVIAQASVWRTSVQFQPQSDGGLIVVSEDRRADALRLIDGLTGVTIALIDEVIWQHEIAVSRDHTTIATLLRPEDDVKLWDAAAGQPRATLPNRTIIDNIALSPDGSLLTSLHQRGNTVALWDTATASTVRTLPTAAVRRIAFSPDGSLLAMVARTGQIEVWGVAASPN